MRGRAGLKKREPRFPHQLPPAHPRRSLVGREKGTALQSMYKRDVWDISFDRETRILMKIIMLQNTELLTLSVCVSDFIELSFELFWLF